LAHVPFLESLRSFRDQARVTPIVLEIQEGQVRDLGVIRDLALVARAYGLKLAFDNFGGSETRLRQLLDFLPDFIKFDYSLIHGLDRAPQHRQRFLADLVKQTRAAGTGAIAEGVESREEFFYCQHIGFDFAQGLYVGRPMCGADLRVATMRTELDRAAGHREAIDCLDQLIQVRKRPDDDGNVAQSAKAQRVRESAGRGASALANRNAKQNATAKQLPRAANPRDNRAAALKTDAARRTALAPRMPAPVAGRK
jgi:hypothetical protein